MKIQSKVNFNLKEIVNAESATQIVKDFGGQTIKLTGILIGMKEEVDEDTGDYKQTKVVVLKTLDGALITSISPTVVNSAETIISAYEDAGQIAEIENGIDVNVCSAKSGKKRDFYFLQLA